MVDVDALQDYRERACIVRAVVAQRRFPDKRRALFQRFPRVLFREGFYGFLPEGSDPFRGRPAGYVQTAQISGPGSKKAPPLLSYGPPSCNKNKAQGYIPAPCFLRCIERVIQTVANIIYQ